MNITNKYGLPAPLVAAVTWSNRNREGCDYTITELLRPPRVAALERRFDAQIEEDASDRLWLLLGSAGHEVLRRSAKTGIVEERAIIEIDGHKIGGQLDYAISDHTIWDYKFTSVWAAKEGTKPEWDQQLNCYRYMCRQYGVDIQRMQIVAIYRDWSKREAARNSDYPQAQVQVFGIPMWADEDVVTFLRSRIHAHESAKTTLPECTKDETWEKPQVFAVKKKGAVRATKLHQTMEAAKAHAASAGLELEVRPAERPRCESYCRAAAFCEQWKAFKAANGVTGS